jgi:predicted Zn-dependent protease
LKRLKFFDGRFLMRLVLWGLLGTALYCLMPLLQSQNADVPVGFWQSLKYTLAGQKNILLGFPKKTLLLISLTSLVPLLLISIRWPQSFGDLSPHGAKFSTFIFHLVQAAFMVACLWIALDPPVSPRNVGLGLPFLTFYYLTALVIGYFAGYFLLLFGGQSSSPTYTYGRSQRSPLRSVALIAVWVLAAAATVGLILRNLPQIQMTNSPMLKDYASLIADRIPEGNTVVLCDDPAREFVLQSALTQSQARPDTLLLNTRSLAWPQYHRMMAERYPERWPADLPTNMQAQVHDLSLVNLLQQFAKSNQVCYAHPSFGYYFETFHATPDGILNLLTPYQEGEFLPPPLSEEAIAFNEQFWDGPATPLLEVVRDGIRLGKTSGPAERRNPLIERLHLQDEKNATAETVGNWLSRSLNSYGVDLQRAGRVKQAARRFQQAVDFNADNVAASVNIKFNADLQADRPSSVNITQSIEDEFGRYRGWQQVVNANGLFDEPRFTMAMAEVFLEGRLFRQSLREFDRVRTLLPDRLGPQVWYARLISLLGDPDQALTVIQEVRNQPQRFALTSTNQLELVFVEAAAYLAKDEPDRVAEVVEGALAASPQNTNLTAAALQLYIKVNLLTNAMNLIDRELLTRPEDVNLLVNKGFVLLRTTNQVSAVEVLSRALELQSNNTPARLNRAIANLQLENLEDAQADYELLLLQFPNSHPIYYGLGEIALRRNDTNQAIYNYQLYLSNAPPNTAEAQGIRQRLESLLDNAP